MKTAKLAMIVLCSAVLSVVAQEGADKKAKDATPSADASEKKTAGAKGKEAENSRAAVSATEKKSSGEKAGSTSKSAAATAEPTCTYGGQSYKKGARLCLQGFWHECGKDGWINLKQKCN
jgi:hypothetical protein